MSVPPGWTGATWLVHLSCGCDFLTAYVPKAGTRSYVSCTSSLAHQSSYRIESAVLVTAGQVPAGEPVQLALFGGEAA